MPTLAPYNVRADYVSDGPVSAADLNRRARILSSQLPGALRAGSLSAGVFPLWEPDESLNPSELLADLAAAAGAALLVTKSGTDFSVAPGAAAILHPAGALVATQTEGLSAEIPPGVRPFFVHLLLRIPAIVNAPGAADSLMGSSPILKVSEEESEEGGLLLASYDGAIVTDRRRFTAPVMLALSLLEARADLGYDAEARAIGDVAKRLTNLEGGGGESPPTTVSFLEQLKWSATDPRNAVTVFNERFADLRAEMLAAIQGNGGGDAFPDDLTVLADNMAGIMAGLMEVNPHAIGRVQMALVVKESGHGQNDTPDFSPDVDDPALLPYNPATGLFGPLGD